LFHKLAIAKTLGSFSFEGASKTRTASFDKCSSIYIDGGKSIDFEAVLDTVAGEYNISRDPRDYLLVPARAVSGNYHNENLDFFADTELTRFDPQLGRNIYATFNLCPSFVNHNAENYRLSRGVIVDSHFNDLNDASDSVKEAVFNSMGVETDKDVFVECLVALDSTKDTALVDGFKTGAVNAFSMGADVESTTCNICGHTASTTFQLCPCIRNKFSRKKYNLSGGRSAVAFEICNGTIFRELSTVDDPADKNALVQDRLLSVAANASNPYNLSNREVNDIFRFVAKNGAALPEALSKLLYSVLEDGGAQ